VSIVEIDIHIHKYEFYEKSQSVNFFNLSYVRIVKVNVHINSSLLNKTQDISFIRLILYIS